MTKIDSIKDVIGDGGFIPPIGLVQGLAVQRECGAAAMAVFWTIAARTDWQQTKGGEDNAQFLECHGVNIAALVDSTAMDRQRVQRALKDLQEADWIARRGNTRPVWILNPTKLRAACANRPAKVQPPISTADSGDVDRILAKLLEGVPADRTPNLTAERGTAAYLLKSRTAEEVCTKIDELREAGQEVFALNYVKNAFRIKTKARSKPAPMPEPTRPSLNPFDYGDEWRAMRATVTASTEATPF